MAQGVLFDGVSSEPRKRRRRMSAAAAKKARADAQRQRYWKNPEKFRAAARASYQANPRSATARRDYMRAYNTDPVKRAQRTQYARKHRAKFATRYEDQRLQRTYGISLADYQRLLNEQDGCCAICRSAFGKSNRGSKRLHVDHDHATGQPRGLLCGACNRGIGQLGDDVERVAAALRYLQQFERRREGAA